jgi:hypothetical protein
MSKRVRYASRHDDGNAFLPDPDGGPITTDDGNVDSELLEEYLLSATSGQESSEDVRNQVVPEEIGGPFVPSTAGAELADDVDESNPIGSRREPVPTPMRGH